MANRSLERPFAVVSFKMGIAKSIVTRVRASGGFRGGNRRRKLTLSMFALERPRLVREAASSSGGAARECAEGAFSELRVAGVSGKNELASKNMEGVLLRKL